MQLWEHILQSSKDLHLFEPTSCNLQLTGGSHARSLCSPQLQASGSWSWPLLHSKLLQAFKSFNTTDNGELDGTQIHAAQEKRHEKFRFKSHKDYHEASAPDPTQP